MKLVINLALSLAVGAACVYLVWPAPAQKAELGAALGRLDALTMLEYVGTLALMHLFRAWRWDYLLRPIGGRLRFAELFWISSAGFMAILALPARLGEFVRPHLARKRAKIRMSAALGTVAVERIVDGLMVSLVVSIACSQLPRAPWWLIWMPLIVFGAATGFLVFGVIWPKQTVRFCLRVSLLEALSPRFAARIAGILGGIISGFRVLGDVRNLAAFAGLSALYWFWNGFGMWLLARGMGLSIPLAASFVTMGVIVVGITLPNSPGLLGQFHYFTKIGLALYGVADGPALAYATVLHAAQTVWYVGLGLIALVPLGVTLRSVVTESAHGDEADDLQRASTAPPSAA